MKRKTFTVLAVVVTFNILSYSTNDLIGSIPLENTQIQSAPNKLLNEFCEYFSNIQDPKQPEELNQKLAHIKELYAPYLKTIKNLSNDREMEIAIGFIFAFEFESYFLDPSIYLNDKLKCLFNKVIFNYSYFSSLTQKEFIQQLSTLAKIHIDPLLKNPFLEPNLNAFYNFIQEIFVDEKDPTLKNKISNIKEVFHPYIKFLNSLLQPEEIAIAIGFIFAYEYRSLLIQNNNDKLKSLKEQVQNYIHALQQEKVDLISYDNFSTIIFKYVYKIPTIIPNPLADSILNEIIECCTDKLNGFFNLSINSRNIEQAFKKYTLGFSSIGYNKDLFCQYFNYLTEKVLRISHFHLNSLNHHDRLPNKVEKLSSFGKHKDSFTYLKIPDFTDGFNAKQIQTILAEVVQKNNNLILDLRDNPGGLGINLMYLLSFFIPCDAILCYNLNNIHEEFLENKNFTPIDYSSTNLEKMIEQLKKNWNDLDYPFQTTIAQFQKLIDQRLKNQPTEIEEANIKIKKYIEASKELQHLNFNNELMKGKIAILYNNASYSSAQLILLYLKTFFPERVKTIGDIGRYNTLASTNYILPQSQLYLQYPTEEFITLDYQRLEGQILTPDIFLTNFEEAMNAAEEWVRKK